MARKPNAAPPAVIPNGHDKDPDDITVEEPTVETEVDATEPDAGTVEDPALVKLREDLAAANARAADAEQRARDRENDLNRERAERGKDREVIQDSRLLVIDSTIQTNETKLEAAKKRAKEALEAGDYDAQVNAQADIAEITLNLKQARMGKERLEQEIEDNKTKPQPTGDPLEDWLSAQPNMGDASKKWLRGHREFVEDPVKNADLTKAHYLAIREGHKPNSREYFDAIETTLGLNGKSREDEPEHETRRGSGSAPAAPVSRDATPNNGAGRRVTDIDGITDLGNGKYRVTKEIADAAQMSGISVKEYVEQARKLKRGSDGLLH